MGEFFLIPGERFLNFLKFFPLLPFLETIDSNFVFICDPERVEKEMQHRCGLFHLHFHSISTV